MNSNQKSNSPLEFRFSKLFSAIGIAFPIYYFSVLTILGLLWSGYNPISNLMSELGAINSPFSFITQFFLFSAMGIVLLIFTILLYYNLKRDYSLYIGLILLFLAGISMTLIGFFPCDAGCIDVTPTGEVHTFLAIAAAIFMPFSMVFFPSSMKQDTSWESKWWILTLLLALISISLSSLGLFELDSIQGLVQRIGIFFPLLWMSLISIKLFKLQSNTTTQ